MSWKEDFPVVLDIGSGCTKFGRAGEYDPKYVFSTVIGRPGENRSLERVARIRPWYAGEDAVSLRDHLSMSSPMRHGNVSNWEDFEHILYHAFNEKMGENPVRHPTLVADSPSSDARDREKMAEVFFETMRVPKLYIQYQPVLALYATASTTGVAVDCGAGSTHIVPIFEGFSLQHTMQSSELGGDHLDENLRELLAEKNPAALVRSLTNVDIENIKREKCYIAQDFEKELAQGQAQHHRDQYTLPDGQSISIGTEAFRSPEGLFQPALLGLSVPGIAECLNSCIRRCEDDVTPDMYGNIVLTGGTSMLYKFADRLKRELGNFSTPSTHIDIHGVRSRQYGAWLGGSMLASSQSFGDLWVTAQEYKEAGASCIHQKCF